MSFKKAVSIFALVAVSSLGCANCFAMDNDVKFEFMSANCDKDSCCKEKDQDCSDKKDNDKADSKKLTDAKDSE